ncbi:MAG: OB-fold nucleic acid binding domain-containing protein [Acidimicrobiia bacterium]|nr:OB-fold nucleic acid binding domain-containing protein [Acidimicrobiia bacterium]
MAHQVLGERRAVVPAAPRETALPLADRTPGTVPISDVQVRRGGTVSGRIVGAETSAWGAGSAYECVLDDGSATVVVVFVGRRTVAGLTTGSCIWARGVVGEHRGRRVMWNPDYGFELANADDLDA